MRQVPPTVGDSDTDGTISFSSTSAPFDPDGVARPQRRQLQARPRSSPCRRPQVVPRDAGAPRGSASWPAQEMTTTRRASRGLRGRPAQTTTTTRRRRMRRTTRRARYTSASTRRERYTSNHRSLGHRQDEPATHRQLGRRRASLGIVGG